MIMNFKVAICKNGHLESSILKSVYVEEKFCKICGEKLICSCPSCSKDIEGATQDQELSERIGGSSDFEIPNYCIKCGKPYPWTEKKLNDFKEILELQEEEITLELQTKIFETVKELISESNPETSLGMTKLGLLIKKLPSKDIIVNTLSGILSSVATEVLKNK